MAKGLFGALKGIDAFGKVSSITCTLANGDLYMNTTCIDNGGCEGQDAYRRAMSVRLPAPIAHELK